MIASQLFIDDDQIAEVVSEFRSRSAKEQVQVVTNLLKGHDLSEREYLERYAARFILILPCLLLICVTIIYKLRSRRAIRDEGGRLNRLPVCCDTRCKSVRLFRSAPQLRDTVVARNHHRRWPPRGDPPGDREGIYSLQRSPWACASVPGEGRQEENLDGARERSQKRVEGEGNREREAL